ncbi:MAG: hypothetical protein HY236_05140 [Acidobacteria bacterium]|nr:hypothetical protein [Acidobacteriota bacterium]
MARLSSTQWKVQAARLLLLGISVGVACLIAEALLRWVFHAAPLLDVNIYYLGAGRNLRMQPGARRRHVTRLWDVGIAINQEGFRDRARPVSSPAPPVLGMGDSFAFGWGVNLEQTYLYLLEQRLNQTRPIRVVKAGTPGTGTSDQFRLLEAIGDQYRPQLVILGLFVGNDFTDVQMGGLEQFDVADGLLIRRELRPARWKTRLGQKLLRSSHLLQFLRASQLSWQQRHGGVRTVHATLAARDPWLYEFSKVHWRDYPPETARGVAETLRYLDQFQDYCRSHHADFLLLVIPRSYQIYPEELRELQDAFQIADRDLDLDRPQRILHEWADRRGAVILDLLPAFRRSHAEQPGEKLFYFPDAHFNVAGHKLTAELLAAFLAERGWPQKP